MAIADCPSTSHHRFPAKDPGERLDYLYDFTELLESGETLTALNSTTVSPTGVMTVEASGIVAASKKVQVILSGGTAGQDYVVSVNVTTSAGGPPTRIFERSAIVPVEEV